MNIVKQAGSYIANSTLGEAAKTTAKTAYFGTVVGVFGSFNVTKAAVKKPFSYIKQLINIENKNSVKLYDRVVNALANTAGFAVGLTTYVVAMSLLPVTFLASATLTTASLVEQRITRRTVVKSSEFCFYPKRKRIICTRHLQNVIDNINKKGFKHLEQVIVPIQTMLKRSSQTV